MVCYAAQNNQLKPVRGNSGIRPSCVTTLAGFFVGDSAMKRIPLTRNKHALIDDEDFELINQYKWYAMHPGRNNYYAVVDIRVNGQRITILMHRLVMNPQKNQEIDHINGNGLDNRKGNLRFCTHQQNLRNQTPRKNCSSKYRGVSWSKAGKKWRAYITYNSRQVHLGYFFSEIEATKTYDKKRKNYMVNLQG